MSPPIKEDPLLLVGTQKGLFRITRGGNRWTIDGPHIAGYEIRHAWLDPREPQSGFATADHPVWGSHLYHSGDGGRSWTALGPAPHHPPGRYDSAVNGLFFLAPGPATGPGVLYAGIDPPGLFVSRDRATTWEPLDGLNRHPTRDQWEPSRGGFMVHSIQIDPFQPRRLYCAVSAGGAYRSDDGGAAWSPINAGVRAENRPDRYPVAGHNIHRLLVHPGRSGRLYRQCYNGVYRSDDAGDHWTEISEGLPSDFGYAVASEPDLPDRLYVVPITSQQVRTVVDARLRVFRTDDAGRTWQALTRGLPQSHAYVSVLREAMDADRHGRIYFGTSSGHLFAGEDHGARWESVAAFLPRILSVKSGPVD